MPLTADVTKFRLAPAAVYWNGTYIGEVSDENPVEIMNDVKAVPLRSARLGSVDWAITEHECYVSVPVVEVTPDKLAMAIPGSETAGNTVTVKFVPGTTIRQFAEELRVVRIINGDASTDDEDIFICAEAAPAPGSISQKFDSKKQQEFTIKFQVFPDATTGEFYHVG